MSEQVFEQLDHNTDIRDGGNNYFLWQVAAPPVVNVSLPYLGFGV